jgi:hypothetical protein
MLYLTIILKIKKVSAKLLKPLLGLYRGRESNPHTLLGVQDFKSYFMCL